MSFRFRDRFDDDFPTGKVVRRRPQAGDIVRDGASQEYEVQDAGMKIVHARPVGGGALTTLFIKDLTIVPKAEPVDEIQDDPYEEFNS
jgi:hypothetical protein